MAGARLVLVLAMLGLAVCTQRPEPSVVLPVDEYGHTVGGERIAECGDMRLTGLGFGLGHFYNLSSFGPSLDFGNFPSFPATNTHGSHFRFKRQAFGAFPSKFPSFSSFNFDDISISSTLGSNPFKTIDLSMSKLDFGSLGGIGPSLSRGVGSPGGASFGSTYTSRFDGKPGPCNPPVDCSVFGRFRSFDGLCNNLERPYWGAAFQPHDRFLAPQYTDGQGLPRLYSVVGRDGGGRFLLPSPRLISRTVHEPDEDGQLMPDIANMFQQFGQFLDHDISATPITKDQRGRDLRCCDGVQLSEANPFHPHVFSGGPCNPIYIPYGDRHFDRNCMNFARSERVIKPQGCDLGHREQFNMVTTFIDASMIYGSSRQESNALRAFNGGRLTLSHQGLLPAENRANITCVLDDFTSHCFRAGEMRVNEHPGLMTMHTLFARYHNRMAYILSQLNKDWNDETIFQVARKIMAGIIQHIAYNEWMPIALGQARMRRYGLSVSSSFGLGPIDWRYKPEVDPRIKNAFSTAAFRFGHSMIPTHFTIGGRKVPIHSMFNRPSFILDEGEQGPDAVCSGLSADPSQHPDRFITPSVTDRLFEDSENISLDLASLNIQRGRDHGLPPYNDYREMCGLPRYRDFNHMAREDQKRARMFASIYRHVDDIDLFPGGLSERPVEGGVVGETFACIIARQFEALKFGDRYWYETQDELVGFTNAQIQEIKKISLSRLICDTTSSLGYMQENTFLQPSRLNPKFPCDRLPDIDFSKWRYVGNRG